MLALSGARLYILLAVLIGLAGSHAWAYHKGKEQERDKATAAALAHREKEQKLIAELEVAKQKREVIYREKIKIIEAASDECLDRPLPDSILNLLRAYGAKAERSNDPRLRPTGT